MPLHGTTSAAARISRSLAMAC
uniref:Uncharacterized protein n=1 Tax=Arundo donax TaxID=35708 RepID=A0A0A9F3C4_ARUDO